MSPKLATFKLNWNHLTCRNDQPKIYPLTQAVATALSPPKTKVSSVKFLPPITDTSMPCIHHLNTSIEKSGNSQTITLHKIHSIAIVKAKAFATCNSFNFIISHPLAPIQTLLFDYLFLLNSLLLLLHLQTILPSPTLRLNDARFLHQSTSMLYIHCPYHL